MKTISVEAQPRSAFGKSNSKRLRREGYLPVEIYGGDENMHVVVKPRDLKEAIYQPGLAVIRIKVEGKEIDTIVKETQFHPLSDELLHVDMLELVPGKPVITEIPIRTEGRAKGVTIGGVLAPKVRSLRVKTVPEKLCDFIVVDVTDLELNKSLKVKDLKEGLDGIEILNNPNAPVVSVITPRALRSKSTAEAGEEGAEAEEEAAAE